MKRQSKSVIYYLGNCLMAISVFSFLFTFYPFIEMNFIKKPLVSARSIKNLTITIPSINAQSPIVKNVDPWDEIAYKKALQKGVAHAKGTSLPGGKGTTFLFAHSSALPWEITQVNTAFFKLNQVKKGDSIYLDENGERLTYKIREIKEVWPNEVNYLLKTDKNQLILQTCTPIGTSLKRLLVFAEEV